MKTKQYVITFLWALSVLIIHQVNAQTKTLLPYAVDDKIAVMASYGDTLIVGGQFKTAGLYTGSLALVSTTSTQPDLSIPKLVPTAEQIDDIVADGKGGWYVMGTIGILKKGATEKVYQIVHLLANKSFDSTFSVPLESAYMVKLAIKDDQLFVFGSFTKVGTVARTAIAMIDLKTGAVSSFAINVRNNTLTGRISEVEISGNTLFVAGVFTEINGEKRTNVAAVDLKTRLLKAWRPSIEQAGTIDALTSYGNKLLIAGLILNGTRPRNCASVDTSTGSVQLIFSAANGLSSSAAIQSMVIERDILYFNANGSFTGDNVVAAYSLQSSQFLWRKYFNSFADSGRLTYYKNRLYLPGHAFKTLNNLDAKGNLVEITKIRNLIALEAATGELTSWQPNPGGENTGLFAVTTGVNHYVSAVAIYNDQVLLGGRFDLLNASPRQGLLMYNTKTNQLLPWQVEFTASSATLVFKAVKVIGNALYLAGNFTKVNGQNSPLVTAFNLQTGQMMNWPDKSITKLEGTISALETTNQTVFLGGDFTLSTSEKTKKNLVAIDRKTGKLVEWSPAGYPHVSALATLGNKLYVGSYRDIDNQTTPKLLAYNLSNLSVVTDKISSLSASIGSVTNLVPTGNLLYINGIFQDNRSVLTSFFGVLDDETSKLITFPKTDYLINTIATRGESAVVDGKLSSGLPCTGQSLNRFSPGIPTGLPLICLDNALSYVWTVDATLFAGSDYYYGATGQITGKGFIYYLGKIRFPDNLFIRGIDDYYPKEGGDNGEVTLTINGSALGAGTNVKLISSSLPEISATDSVLSYPEAGQVRAVLNLRGKALGVYTILLTRPDGTTLTIPDGFTIQTYKKTAVWASLSGPTSIRTGRVQNFSLYYGTNGNTDAKGHILWVAIPQSISAVFPFDISTNSSAVDSLERVGKLSLVAKLDSLKHYLNICQIQPANRR